MLQTVLGTARKKSPEAEGSPHRGQDNGVLGTGTQDTVSGSRRATDAGKLRFEDQEEEALPEEVTGEEVPSPQKPNVALVQLNGGPEKDVDEGVSEMSRLSISQRFPSVSSVGGRKRRRLLELAKPKTNWQVLKDRTGCCCKGYAWVSPCKRNLQFCVYWPSVYWTERFLEDTTLTITVPEVSRRVEELARPKRFYSEYYSNNRITPIWPVSRSSLEHHASSRLRELAAPRIRNNIWSINMSEPLVQFLDGQSILPPDWEQPEDGDRIFLLCGNILELILPCAKHGVAISYQPKAWTVPEFSALHVIPGETAFSRVDCIPPDEYAVSQVSRAAQMAIPSPRILRLAEPRSPATLLEEWDPMPKPKPHASDYNRLLHLATPKAQSNQCVPDRDPRWEVLDGTKKAVASPRIISLAKPKVRKDLNEGYDPYYISPASLAARASPRLYELATPKSVTKKV